MTARAVKRPNCRSVSVMITETACFVPFFANIDLPPTLPLRCDTKAIVRRAVSGRYLCYRLPQRLVITSFGRAFSATSPDGLVWRSV